MLREILSQNKQAYKKVAAFGDQVCGLNITSYCPPS